MEISDKELELIESKVGVIRKCSVGLVGREYAKVGNACNMIMKVVRRIKNGREKRQ